MEQTQKVEYYSTLSIQNLDGSKRVIRCIGKYSNSQAKALSIDIEGKNFASVEVVIN